MEEHVVHRNGRHFPQGLAASGEFLSDARMPWAERPAPAGLYFYFAAVIDSTLIVLVGASSVPVTWTFCAANFDGVS